MIKRFLSLQLNCVLVTVVLVGCSRSSPTSNNSFSSAMPLVSESGSSSGAAVRSRIVVFGDSLTAGLGLSIDEAYPAQLQGLAESSGYSVEIVPRGESGGTTAGGVRRLDWSLDGNIRVVIVALGGNDGLRGLPVEQMRDNLSAVVERIRARGARVVLAGMEAPPNFGFEYTSQFRQVFRTVAEEYDLVFVPFLLEGVAGVAELNQDDGIHPNAAGAKRVAENLWTALEPLLSEQVGRSDVMR